MRRLPLRDPPDLLQHAHVGQHLTLPERAAHYLRDVLRLRAGERVEVFDGRGAAIIAVITRCEADAVELEVSALREAALDAMESPLAITLCQAIPKGDRWEWIMEKVTELGVHAIQPVLSARTVVKLPADRRQSKHERWQRMLDEAARQSQRLIVPTLHPAFTLDELLAGQQLAQGLHLVASPHHEGPSLEEALSHAVEGGEGVSLWIGPEGGWSEEEVEALCARGARPISLGPRVLRADTAAISAVTLAQYIAGDLR